MHDGGDVEAFLSAYLGEARGNPVVAARMAGFASPVADARDLLRSEDVQSRLAELRAQLDAEDESVAKPVEVARLLTSVMRGELVDVDRYGAPIPPKAGDRIRASKALLELLGFGVGAQQQQPVFQQNIYNGAAPRARYTPKDLVDMESELIAEMEEDE